MMEKKPKLGTVLRGDAARRFNDYIKNPTDTPKGRELMRDAARIAKKRKLF